jgi:CubicO group peptidase (beta-lactamase class C family)
MFVYSVGLAEVESGTPLTPDTRMHIGSLTKLITAALTLLLDDRGELGPDGLDTPVDRLLSATEIQRLTLGDDPYQANCPATILAFSRPSGFPMPTEALCPDFSRITVRHLLNGNHGLWDPFFEVDRSFNLFPDSVDFMFGSLFEAAGVPHSPLPRTVEDDLSLLAAMGVLANPEAAIGGRRFQDFEPSFGNAGYQILGIIVDRLARRPDPPPLRVRSYHHLARLDIANRLRIEPFFLLDEVPGPDLDRLVAGEYSVTTGGDQVNFPVAFGEDLFGVYPTVEIAGNPAVNLYELDSFLATNGGGGAGAGVAEPRSYLEFFEALITGGLLPPSAQAKFDSGFVELEEVPPSLDPPEGLSHGFGVFRYRTRELGRVFSKSGGTFGGECNAFHFGDHSASAVACRNSSDLFLGRLLNAPPSAVHPAPVALELLGAVIDSSRNLAVPASDPRTPRFENSPAFREGWLSESH